VIFWQLWTTINVISGDGLGWGGQFEQGKGNGNQSG